MERIDVLTGEEVVQIVPGIERRCADCSIGDLKQAQVSLFEANEGAALRVGELSPGESEAIEWRNHMIKRITATLEKRGNDALEEGCLA
jgi:hypothetical protein